MKAKQGASSEVIAATVRVRQIIKGGINEEIYEGGNHSLERSTSTLGMTSKQRLEDDSTRSAD